MSLREPGSDEGAGEGTGGGPARRHIGQLRLQRLRIGELPAEQADQARQHLGGCESCRSREETLAAEERAFSQSISFARFAGGVERAARVPRTAHPGRRRAILGGALAFAAAAVGLLLIQVGGAPVIDDWPREPAGNRRKGEPAINVSIRIASADGRTQRGAVPGSVTKLAPGERLRIGYSLPQPGHLLLVSIDDDGEVTPLSTEGEAAAMHPATSAVTHLPDSIELTGTGKERVYLFVSELPVAPHSAADAVRAAHAAARGDLERAGIPTLPPRVRAFTWLFEKP